MPRKFLIILLIFTIIAGCVLYAKPISDLPVKFTERFKASMRKILNYHLLSLDREATHYFLLPRGSYTYSAYVGPLSFGTISVIIWNAFSNAVIQPVFLCVFTPQSVLNCVLFPFFVYACIRYIRKVPLMVFACLAIMVYSGLHGSVVEALIRHRTSCELIYLLLGLAGFTALMQRSS